MAFARNASQKHISLGDRAIAVEKTPHLDRLETKLKTVAAALGKKKGDIIAEALDEYLTKKWAEVIKSYNESEE